MPGKKIFVAALTQILVCASLASAARYDTDVDGKVVAIEGTVVIIKDPQGQLFRAETARSGPDIKGQKHTYRSECLIEVVGREWVKNLQPGMALQLECRLANRRAIVGEVQKLTLITATAATQAGVLSAEPVAAADNEEQTEKTDARQLEDCLVVGQLVKNKNGNLTIAYAGAKGTIELFLRRAPTDQVEVLGSNLSVVSPGDKIRAQGYTHGLPHFFAREVKVEHVPFVEAKDRPRQPNTNVIADAKPGQKAQQPFELADPEEAAKVEAANKNGKVKLQIIKVN